MIKAIELLRKTADDCENRAKQISDRGARAELIDICAEWHCLAREAANLHDRTKRLSNAETVAAGWTPLPQKPFFKLRLLPGSLT
jgi:hypothetical protein